MLRIEVSDISIGAQGRQAIADLLTAWKRVEKGTSVGILGVTPGAYRRVVPIFEPLVVVLDLFAVVGFHGWFPGSVRDGGSFIGDGKKGVAGSQKKGSPENGREESFRIGIRVQELTSV